MEQRLNYRIWIGPEREGAQKGEQTIFVEAEIVNLSLWQIVMQLSEKYACNRLYFGAGKKDIRESILIPKSRKVKTIVECSCVNINKIAGKGYSEIIIRVDIPNLKELFSIKTDNDKEVVIYKPQYLNEICTDKGLYLGDRIICQG